MVKCLDWLGVDRAGMHRHDHIRPRFPQGYILPRRRRHQTITRMQSAYIECLMVWARECVVINSFTY